MYSEKELEKRWQTNVIFPDWISVANYSANNILTFEAYKGQGKLYLTAEEDCSFKLFVNNSLLPMKLKSGEAYEADLSSVTKNVTAYIYGFSVSDVEKVLNKNLGNKLLACKETQFNKLVIEEEAGLENPKGIILEAEDLSFRCRLTVTQAVSKVLDKNRSELSQSLFGGQL